MRYGVYAVLAVLLSAMVGCQTTGGKATGGNLPDNANVLFDGTCMAKWEAVPADPNADMSEAFVVKDGAIVCSGQPIGMLRTKKDYSNYRLSYEWRWAPGSNGGNSGLLVNGSAYRKEGPWPQSLEVQLKAGNAGDFYAMNSDFKLVNPDGRRDGRHGLNLTDDSEKPIGEWNRMDVNVMGGEIMVWVNGDLVNQCTGCTETTGYIAFQSEGAPIHFRNIVLTPLD